MKKNLLFGLVISVLLYGVFTSACTSGGQTDAMTDSAQIDSSKLKPQIDLTKYDRYYNDFARLAAGLEQEKGSAMTWMDTLQSSIKFRNSIALYYDTISNNTLSKVELFAKNEMTDVNEKTETLFYPFSGPDFMFADAFFPNAKKIIMFGLEPVGEIPRIDSMDEAQLHKFYTAIRIAIDSLKPLGYFMTFEMGRDFNREANLSGIVPTIALFMVRRNYRVLNARRVTVNKAGELVDSLPGLPDYDNVKDDYISGGLIEYMRDGDTEPRQVIYFSHNASNESLQRTPEFVEFLKKQDFDATFLKAASYLCSWMSTVRDIILTTSEYVLQDDSGIPLRYFKKEAWDLKYYGSYVRTLKALKAYFQKDLKEVYETDTTVKPLEFGLGYGIRLKQSNLMMARQKSGLVNVPDTSSTK